jgi:hypothetical protein
MIYFFCFFNLILTRVFKVFKRYIRKNSTIYRYFTPSHIEQKANKMREEILHQNYKKYNTSDVIDEGLTTIKYNIIKITKEILFTHILVDYF